LRQPLLRDGARDQRADLLSILCDLRFEIGNASFLGLIGRLLARESLRQRQEMASSIGERSFAFPRLGVNLRAGYPIVPNGAVSINKPWITMNLMSRESDLNHSDFSYAQVVD
jgi:hypothetical protein